MSPHPADRRRSPPRREDRPRGLGRTQRLTLRILRDRAVDGADPLFEALLRRGFLARRSPRGLFLAPGAHPRDVVHLARLFECRLAEDGSTCLALRGTDPWEAVRGIVGIGEHRRGMIACPRHDSWRRYRKMVWGHKVSAGPDSEGGHGGLDIGVALLVKALPLARVMTVDSCDGHGERPAHLEFASIWDQQWFWALGECLGLPDHGASWTLASDGLHKVRIAADGGQDDASLIAWLDDIHAFARRLLDQSLIAQIGTARSEVLEMFAKKAPRCEAFSEAARHVLGSCGLEA